jgi:hypothetical protein
MRRLAMWMSVTFAACVPAGADAQDETRAPPPPESAPPVTAPPAEVPEGLPPHPAFPDPLDEPHPTEAELATTEFVWLPGHWVWTGEAYRWREGEWIHPLEGYVLVPPRWEWSGESWVFHHAGWAPLGSDVVAFAPVPVTEEDLAEGAPVEAFAEPPPPLHWWAAGAYVAPLVIYPRWHPFYHYYFALGHPYYLQYPPLYRSPWYRFHRYGVPYRGAAYRPPRGPLPMYRSPPPRTATRRAGPSSYYRAKPSSWSSRSSYRPPSYPRGTRAIRPGATPPRSAAPPRGARPAPQRSPGARPAPQRSPGARPAPAPPRRPSYSPGPSPRPAPMRSPPGRSGGGRPRR